MRHDHQTICRHHARDHARTRIDALAQTPARPADQPRSVTLTLAEYNRLLDLAARAPAAAGGRAGGRGGRERRSASITVDREIARGAFNLAGQVLQDRHQPRAAADRRDAGRRHVRRPAGAARRRRPDAATRLIAGPGPFAIAAEWGGPLVFTPGRASFVLPVPQAGAARATIDLPGEQADVRLSAGLDHAPLRRERPHHRRSHARSGSATEVWWSMRDSAPVAAAKDVRALADIMTLVTLDDSDVRMAALIDVTRHAGRAADADRRAAGRVTSCNRVSGSTLERFTPLAGSDADSHGRQSGGAQPSVPRHARTRACRRHLHARHRRRQPEGRAARAR